MIRHRFQNNLKKYLGYVPKRRIFLTMMRVLTCSTWFLALTSAVFILWTIFDLDPSGKSKSASDVHGKPVLQIVTLAKIDEFNSDAFRRLYWSANFSGLQPLKVITVDEHQPKHSYINRIDLLHTGLLEIKNLSSDPGNTIVFFVHPLDTLIVGKGVEILKRFLSSEAKILFASEAQNEKGKFRRLFAGASSKQRELNAGSFIGYLPDLLQLTDWRTHWPYKELKTNDLNTFFRISYRDKFLRSNLSLKLDHQSEIFQIITADEDEVQLEEKGSEIQAINLNKHQQKYPLVISGGDFYGRSKKIWLSNYLPNNWKPEYECLECKRLKFEIRFSHHADEWPTVTMAFVLDPPYVKDIRQRLELFLRNLNYPTRKITLQFITFTDDPEAVKEARKLGKKLFKPLGYKAVVIDYRESNAQELFPMNEDNPFRTDFYFFVDHQVLLRNPQTLIHLVEQNRAIIAPMLTVSNESSVHNFQPLSQLRNPPVFKQNDTSDLLLARKRGVWSVPCASGAILLNVDKTSLNSRASIIRRYSLPGGDMKLGAICSSWVNPDQGQFVYISNMEDFGEISKT